MNFRYSICVAILSALLASCQQPSDVSANREQDRIQTESIASLAIANNDFGYVQPDETRKIPVTIYNTSQKEKIVIRALSIGDDKSGFRIDNFPALPIVLDPSGGTNAALTLSVTFSSSSIGPHGIPLLVNDSASDRIMVKAAVSLDTIDADDTYLMTLPSLPRVLDFGETVLPGGGNAMTLIAWNTHPSKVMRVRTAITHNSSNPSADAFSFGTVSIPNIQEFYLAPNQTQRDGAIVSILYRPQAVGNYAGTLSFGGVATPFQLIGWASTPNGYFRLVLPPDTTASVGDTLLLRCELINTSPTDTTLFTGGALSLTNTAGNGIGYVPWFGLPFPKYVPPLSRYSYYIWLLCYKPGTETIGVTAGANLGRHTLPDLYNKTITVRITP